MPRKRIEGNLALADFNDIFQATVPATAAPADGERIVELPLPMLYPPEFHPFQVREDDAMQRLAESIKKGGVRVPAIVRLRDEGGYELVAGNRRKYASGLAGIQTLPCIIREMDNDEATLVMVDTNLEQRETLLPSERGWAYRLKLEAMNHRGVKGDTPGELSVTILCEQAGVTKSTVFRYVCLTELVPGLIDRVDEKKIKVVAGVELSYLSRKDQSIVIEGIERHDNPSPSQAKLLREAGENGGLTQKKVDAIMLKAQKQPNSLKLADSLIRQYFPDSYTPKQMQTVIVGLLEAWHRKKAG